MIQKIKAWIGRRKFYRLCIKGEKIVNELKDWGCDDFTCNECPALDKYHNCGVYSEMQKYNRQLEKVVDKYGAYLNMADEIVLANSKMGVDTDG